MMAEEAITVNRFEAAVGTVPMPTFPKAVEKVEPPMEKFGLVKVFDEVKVLVSPPPRPAVEVSTVPSGSVSP
jgi:hypothetical protein